MEVNVEKLKILLSHWVEHNEEHAKEFKEWAERAKGIDAAVYEGIMEAAQRMEEVNSSLLKALKRLHGDGEGS